MGAYLLLLIFKVSAMFLRVCLETYGVGFAQLLFDNEIIELVALNLKHCGVIRCIENACIDHKSTCHRKSLRWDNWIK